MSRQPRLKRVLIIIAGALLMVVGAVGLFLPFLQGVLMMFVGFSLLASQIESVRRLKDRLEAKFPAQFEAARASKRWFKRKLRLKPRPEGNGA